MKTTIVFLACLLIAGCCSVRESVMETERDVQVRAATPALKEIVPGRITDSTIVALKIVKKDTVANVSVSFVVDDSIKTDSAKAHVRKKTKRILRELNDLPVQPQAAIDLRPDSVDVTVKVKDRVVEKVREFGFIDYLKIGSLFFVIGLFFGLLIKR